MSPHAPLAFDPVQPISWYMANTSHGRIKTPEYPEDTVAAGEHVRCLRLERGLNLRLAADILKIKAEELSKIESGCVRLRAPAIAMSFLSIAWRKHDSPKGAAPVTSPVPDADQTPQREASGEESGSAPDAALRGDIAAQLKAAESAENRLREALARAEQRELAALAELDEAAAVLRMVKASGAYVGQSCEEAIEACLARHSGSNPTPVRRAREPTPNT